MGLAFLLAAPASRSPPCPCGHGLASRKCVSTRSVLDTELVFRNRHLLVFFLFSLGASSVTVVRELRCFPIFWYLHFAHPNPSVGFFCF